MKKNRILCALSAAALLMAGACSDDTLQSGNGRDHLNTDETGGVYMTVDFKMPDGAEGTRSETTNDGGSTGGVEVGSEAENNVTTALIVLASASDKTVGDFSLKKYGYIAAGQVNSNHISLLNSANKEFTAAAKLSKANLNTLYDIYTTTAEDGTVTTDVPTVYVFVFANPTKELTEVFANADEEGGIGFGSDAWVDMTCRVTQNNPNKPNYNLGIWGENSFLMNNKTLTRRELPRKLLDWENYNSYDNAFHLSRENKALPGEETGVNNAKTETNPDRGSVRVERSVARFDFKDGSKQRNDETKSNNNTYDVLFMTKEDGNIDASKPIVEAQIQKMCLVNMGNSFYYLPRVSDSGQLPAELGEGLCDTEKPWERNQNTGQYHGGNYVVGPWAKYFKNAASYTTDAFLSQFEPPTADYADDGFYKYVNYPFFNEDGSFNNEDMKGSKWDVVKVDNVLKGLDDNYQLNGHNPGDYKVWRYVVENVIPAKIDNQVNGISTGVVFKAQIKGTDIALKGEDLYEESWNKGAIENLAKCLNGKETFIYNNKDMKLGGDSKDPVLYYFSGRLYMGWRHIRQAAIQASVTINRNNEIEINRSNSLYKAVFGDGPIAPEIIVPDGSGNTVKSTYYDSTGTPYEVDDPRWAPAKADPKSADWLYYLESADYAWTEWVTVARDEEMDSNEAGQTEKELLANMRKAVTDAGITIYQSSNDDDYGPGYYCYYYYWNRHNDNGLNGSMGPMEFDVVRNNVYKLSIDKISRLGHPRIPENDPNNPTPDTPDESDDIYLDVNIEIVPWVVRINGITF